MTFLGDFTPEGNFAEKVDRLVLGHFRDGVFWNEDGSWSFSAHYNYTWIWSSLTFGATVMLGAFAGKIMKAGKDNRRKVVQTLLIIGISLIAFSLIWSLQMPIIKRLWTSSMTLFSGGLCFLLMGAFYYRIDYKGHSRGLNWLKIYGMNSITAYILGEVINFRCIAHPSVTDWSNTWVVITGVVKLCQLSDCIPYLTDHVQAEDIPEDLSGKIGSVSHLQNHSAKRNRIALFANRAPIHFGCFRRKRAERRFRQ